MYSNIEINSLKITILVDDQPSQNEQLTHEHGLSLLLTLNYDQIEKNILFDTGYSFDSVSKNIKALNIDINNIDAIVLSHCHKDHSSGIINVLRNANKPIPILCHNSFFRESFSCDPFVRYTGIIHSKEELSSAGGNLIMLNDSLEIMPHVFYSGEIKRCNDFENQVTKFFTINNGSKVCDKLLDEVCLCVTIKDKGLLIITACSHPGIINIINHCMKVTGIHKLYGIIGGLHLMNSDINFINKTINELSKFPIEYMSLGHCTGDLPFREIKRKFASKVTEFHTGSIIKII